MRAVSEPQQEGQVGWASEAAGRPAGGPGPVVGAPSRLETMSRQAGGATLVVVARRRRPPACAHTRTTSQLDTPATATKRLEAIQPASQLNANKYKQTARRRGALS